MNGLQIPLHTLSTIVLPSLGVSAVALHLYLLSRKPLPAPDAFPAYLFPAVASHGRHLPVSGRNAFAYPVLFIGADLDALEEGSVDEPFRLIHYGGNPMKKVLGIRPTRYLFSGENSIRSKLEKLLEKQGIAREMIGRIWVHTMPSILGFEGINPLNVFYVYGLGDATSRRLLCVALEVHNAFSESHCYVLRVDSPLRHEPAKGYDLAFTFPRSFHVSPYNTRNGSYQVDVIDPFPPGWSETPGFTPRFKVIVRLMTVDDQLKLTVVLSSGPSPPTRLERSVRSVSGVLWALARWPGTLFLVQTRAYWQAYKLHYWKNLAIYPRPEPPNPLSQKSFNPPQEDEHHIGVVLQRPLISGRETTARNLVEKWAERRSKTLDVGLEIVFHNEREPLLVGAGKTMLKIETADSELFVNLLISPSPEQFLLLAPERLTHVADSQLFTTFFGPPSVPERDFLARTARSIRRRQSNYLYSFSRLSPPPSISNLAPNTPHFTDTNLLSRRDRFTILNTVFWSWYGGMHLGWIFHILRGKFVPGQEPWSIWDRVLKRMLGQDVNSGVPLGSVSCS
nr:hypothetical protein L203_01653 [Cryptococcus depauperatus CBS 7841]